MAIQQVAGSNTNGILSFLFQDDGSAEGTVLEGAEFAKTLHQLLGEYDGEHAAQPGTPMAAELATVITDTEAEFAELTAPLTAGLDALAGDFTLPAHGAALPPEQGWEGAAEGQELEQPFWGIAPFTDMMAALQEHSAVPQEHAELPVVEAALPEAAKADSAASVPMPAFSRGIQHLIELARDAEQAATQLTQPAPLPAPVPTAAGRYTPTSGKLLPQSFRPTNLALQQAIGMAQARGTQSAAAGDALPAAFEEASFGAIFGGSFAEVPSAEPRTQQGTAAPATATALGVQNLRTESALPAAAKSSAETAAATPQFDSQHIAGTEAWFEDLGTRVEWLKDMNIEKAELQLHPAELGMLEIQISTADDATTVSFVTHNSEARELIEDSMPKLRELLASQGMQLGESQVSQHSAGQRNGQEPNERAASQLGASAGDEAAPVKRRAYVADPNRIDHYV